MTEHKVILADGIEPLIAFVLRGEEQPPLMVLSKEQTAALGTGDEYKGKQFEVLAQPEGMFFTNHDYTFSMDEGGYCRHVPLIGDEVHGAVRLGDRYAAVQKRVRSARFYPTLATHKGWFGFEGPTDCVREHADDMAKKLGDYLTVTWVESQKTIVVEVKNPTDHILEFDFGCYSYGPSMCVLAHKKQ